MTVFILLLLASLPAFLACTDCTSLVNNDNLPQGDGPLLFLYRGENFQDGPIGIPEGFVSQEFAQSIRSLKCPPGYEVILTDQPENMGDFRILSGDIPSLGPYHFAGRVKSLRYSRVMHTQIFEEPEFAGKQWVFPFGLSVIPEGDVLFGGGSIKVPPGLKVTVVTKKKARLPHSVEDVYTSDQSTMPNLSDPIVTILVELKHQLDPKPK